MVISFINYEAIFSACYSAGKAKLANIQCMCDCVCKHQSHLMVCSIDNFSVVLLTKLKKVHVLPRYQILLDSVTSQLNISMW